MRTQLPAVVCLVQVIIFYSSPDSREATNRPLHVEQSSEEKIGRVEKRENVRAIRGNATQYSKTNQSRRQRLLPGAKCR